MKRLIFMLLLGMFFVPVSNAQLWKSKRYQASVYAGTSQYSSGNDLFYTVGFSALYKFRLTKPKPSSGVKL